MDKALDKLAKMLRNDDGSDATSGGATPAEYETAGRAYLQANFERLFGLRILEAAHAHRAEGDIVSRGATVEWDFRVPVNISGSPSFRRAPECHIYPNHERYLPPMRPARARELTPTKLPNGAASASDFMAVFEMTTAKRWPSGLLKRLEQRLAVSLDRARSLNPGPDDLGILDVVAVVGVIGTDACVQSVSTVLAMRAAVETPLLKALADAARFVFVLRPFVVTP